MIECKMKLICFSQQRLGEQLIYYSKTDNTLLRNNRHFYIPNFSQEIYAEMAVYVKIAKIGKCISRKHASRYYSEVGHAINFFAKDIEATYRANNLPVNLSYNFDFSTAVSKTFPVAEFAQQSQSFEIGAEKVDCQSTDLIASIEDCLVEYSKYSQVKIGDFLVVPYFREQRKLTQGSVFKSSCGNAQVFNFHIR